jgi:crossover junction endodeoxyribonuclease RuvC
VKIENSPKTLRVLGVDPGTATTGWAVLEEKDGNVSPIAFGHISTDKNKTEESRLFEISDDLQKIIDKYRPQEASVEQLFFFKNKKTIIQVGQARGAILLTLRQKNVSIFNYTPLQVKQSLTGYGRAEKEQLQLMVRNILRLKSLPKPDDTADAIALALCHINSRKMRRIGK